MFSAQQLQQKAAEWISGKIALRDFHLWFESEAFDLRQSADKSAAELAGQIDVLLAEYTGGYLPVAELRRELAEAIRPFEPIVLNSDVEESVLAEIETRSAPATLEQNGTVWTWRTPLFATVAALPIRRALIAPAV